MAEIDEKSTKYAPWIKDLVGPQGSVGYLLVFDTPNGSHVRHYCTDIAELAELGIEISKNTLGNLMADDPYRDVLLERITTLSK